MLFLPHLLCWSQAWMNPSGKAGENRVTELLGAVLNFHVPIWSALPREPWKPPWLLICVYLCHSSLILCPPLPFFLLILPQLWVPKDLPFLSAWTYLISYLFLPPTPLNLRERKSAFLRFLRPFSYMFTCLGFRHSKQNKNPSLKLPFFFLLRLMWHSLGFHFCPFPCSLSDFLWFFFN